MKVITYVKEEVSKPLFKVVHDIRTGHSLNEELEHWSDVCTGSMQNGRIVDYHVELFKQSEVRL